MPIGIHSVGILGVCHGDEGGDDDDDDDHNWRVLVVVVEPG